MLPIRTNEEAKDSAHQRYLIAVLCSLLFHGLAINLFLFQFPVKEWSVQSQLFFLGSILKSSDVSSLLPEKKTSSSSKISSDNFHPFIPTLSQRYNVKLDKPAVSKDQKKITNKSLFGATLIKNDAPKKSNPQEMKFETNEHYYKPLNIYTDDQN